MHTYIRAPVNPPIDTHHLILLMCSSVDGFRMYGFGARSSKTRTRRIPRTRHSGSRCARAPRHVYCMLLRCQNGPRPPERAVPPPYLVRLSTVCTEF